MNISNPIPRAILLAGLIFSCTALSAPALAADDAALPQAAFSVRGVDFTSLQAVAHLKRQLSRVATGICFRNTGSHLLLSSDERACYATAVNDGLTQIASREQQAMRDRAVRLADAGAAANSNR